MLITALMLFALLVVILLCSVLTFISYVVALSTSLVGETCSSPLLPPMRSMLLGNRRSSTDGDGCVVDVKCFVYAFL